MALDDIRVVELAGLAPGPFAGLILADWGADVIRVDRPDAPSRDTLTRHKRSVALDIKHPAGLALLRRLVARADVLVDPYRPGVLERLGLGPDVFLGTDGLNTRLVYARLAGFSPTGAHRDMAGHDINYLALSGVLSMLPGDSSKPAFPLNILADFAGGGMTCALGILLALHERTRSGLGQVVSTNMVAGTRYLSTYPLLQTLLPSPSHFRARSFPPSPPASSKAPTTRMAATLDGGCPFYNVYTCADGRWMSLGCLEPQFYAAFVARFVPSLPAGLLARLFPDGWTPRPDRQFERETEWPRLRTLFEAGFRAFDRDHWAAVFHGSDACAVPVLSPAEAAALSAVSDTTDATEAAAADSATAAAAGTVPAPHPRLSRTPARPLPGPDGLTHTHLVPGEHTEAVLREVLGVGQEEMGRLWESGAFGRGHGRGRVGERSKL